MKSALHIFYCLGIFTIAAHAQPSIEWQKSLGESNIDVCVSIRQTSDGGYIACGNSSSNNGDVSGNHFAVGSPTGDFWIVKTNTMGNIEWQRSFGGAKTLEL